MAYLETDNEFLDEWAEKWCSLGELIFETIRTDKPAGAPLQPGILEENLYQSLRSWFIESEPRFLPLWKDYYQSLDWNLDISQDIIQQIYDADKCLENPFLAFYMLESLDALLHRIPTEEQAWNTALALLALSSLVPSFITGRQC